jgi:hypothetical protein
MSDRELLEKAAKAAGLSMFVWGTKGAENFTIKLPDGSPGARWNPLTDDGDALPLAVKFGMLFTYMHDRHEMFQRFYREELDNDLKPSEATRRAIVRAAAAIGEQP